MKRELKGKNDIMTREDKMPEENSTVLDQTAVLEYLAIDVLARQGKREEALVKVEKSHLPESTKDQLARALRYGGSYVVTRTLDEMDARIAQALCWGCWR